MSESNPIRVFVTHGFKESDDYLRIFEFLESVDRFFYLNVSKPDDPPTGGKDELKDELIRQIKESEAVIVLPLLFEMSRDLVDFMMQAADANHRPMIVIKPFGGVAETPAELIERCQEHIEWNARDMADTLRMCARGKETQRWETIDFPGYNSDGEIEK